MRVYYDRDADLNLIKGKKVVIVGYGSQGHAHALNLKDSGVKDVAIALRKGSASAKKAEAAGFKVMEVAEAAKWGDLVMMLTPDELQGDIYREHLADNMKKGAALVFAHGLNVHFNLLDPRADLDVLMIAPKGPGHTVRSEYQRGAFLHVRAKMLAVQVALAFVRRQHHDHIGPFRRIGGAEHLEAGGFGLLGAGAGAQADGDIGLAAVAQVHRMGMALAAEADDGHLLRLDQVHVGVAVVVNAHGCATPSLSSG